MKYSMRYLQLMAHSQSRDFLQSISMVDKQHFSQQIFPMNPIYYCHDLDNYLHKRGPQRTALFSLSVGLTHNE